MKMTVGLRIALGFSALIILLVVVAGFSYFTIQNIANLAVVVKDNTESNMFIIEKEVDHLTWVQQLDLSLLSGQEFTGQLDHTKCSFGNWLYSDEVQNAKDPELKRLFAEIETPHEELHNSAVKITDAKDEGNEVLALEVYEKETAFSLNMVRNIMGRIRERYNEIAVETAGEAAKDMAASAANSRVIILILSIAAGVIGIILAVLISRQIIRILKRIIAQLSESAQQVASASGQLSSSSQRLAEGSAEQASSLEETSSTLEEASSMVRQNTENTKQAAILSKKANDAATKGNREMKEMMGSMSELKKSSDEISKIIKVIDDIAFQTNILALNAAVEAARAGDAGMGFAVVAEEVRTLAQRSAQAAKDTANIIEKNIELAGEGVEVSEGVNGALIEINEQSQKVNELLDEIAAASDEQSQGIMQINKAVSEMDQVVQENASTAEESASASEELSAQAKNLKENVNMLVELVTGKKGVEDYQTSETNNNLTRSQKSKAKNKINQTKLQTRGKTKETYIVKPEDVIPLEDDPGDF